MAPSRLATIKTRKVYGSRVDLGVAVGCGVALIVDSGDAELWALGDTCGLGDPCSVAVPLGEARGVPVADALAALGLGAALTLSPSLAVNRSASLLAHTAIALWG